MVGIDVIDKIIWNVKNIVVDKQSFFEKHLFCQGIVKIGDLLSNMGKFLQSLKVLAANLSHLNILSEYPSRCCGCYSDRVETYKTVTNKSTSPQSNPWR